MKNNNENKNLILKNSISFIISLCPIYSFILFMVYLRINGIYLKGGIGDYFGLIAILPFIVIIIFPSLNVLIS